MRGSRSTQGGAVDLERLYCPSSSHCKTLGRDLQKSSDAGDGYARNGVCCREQQDSGRQQPTLRLRRQPPPCAPHHAPAWTTPTLQIPPEALQCSPPMETLSHCHPGPSSDGINVLRAVCCGRTTSLKSLYGGTYAI